MSKWVIDPDHSVAAFVVSHMMVANVHGQFNKIKGVIHFDHTDIPNSSVELSIDVSGIYTGIQKRDGHLRSPDFFDVEKYPYMTFKSTKTEMTEKNRIKVFGDLTIHSITRQIAIDVAYSGPEQSPYGETSMGFTATAKINREDYGITWNVELKNGGFMVGKEIQIVLDIEADLASE
jgi:polyisoprenoid-binding protein YceI